MKLAKALLGGMWAVVGILALLAEDAWSRPPTEVCQSDGRYQYCPANTRGGVRLQRQLSKSPCIPNQTWGFDRGGIWVNKGCRAEFALGGYGGGPNGGYGGGPNGGYGGGPNGGYGGGPNGGYGGGPNGGYGGGRRFVCDAEGHGYRYCRAHVRDGVRLIRQLSKSPCRLNNSWGYDRGGVWVDKGCRAEFEVR